MKLTWEQCAEVLMVSRTTLCRELGYRSYSDISPGELDAVIERLAQQYPKRLVTLEQISNKSPRGVAFFSEV